MSQSTPGPAPGAPPPQIDRLPPVGGTLDIYYRRIGKPQEDYRLIVLDSRPEVVVTFQPRTPIDAPIVIDDFTILEPRSPVVWFTFPGKWHDIGLFFRTNGAFTGTYANVLTPVDFIDTRTWATTDLCLDVWVPRWGPVRTLDEDELEEVEDAGRIDDALAERARSEARSLVHAHRAGAWPPPEIGEWSLARALKVLQSL